MRRTTEHTRQLGRPPRRSRKKFSALWSVCRQTGSYSANRQPITQMALYRDFTQNPRRKGEETAQACAIDSMTMSAVSSALGAYWSVHSEECAISLSLNLCAPTKARSQSVFGSPGARVTCLAPTSV